MFARVTAVASATVLLTARIDCDPAETQDISYVQLASGVATSATWTQLDGTLVVPSAEQCELQSLAIYAEGPPPGVALLVDDALLQRL